MLHARSNRHVAASFLWAMMHVMAASSKVVAKVRGAPEMSQNPPSPFNPPNSICATGDESASRELQGIVGREFELMARVSQVGWGVQVAWISGVFPVPGRKTGP